MHARIDVMFMSNGVCGWCTDIPIYLCTHHGGLGRCDLHGGDVAGVADREGEGPGGLGVCGCVCVWICVNVCVAVGWVNICTCVCVFFEYVYVYKRGRWQEIERTLVVTHTHLHASISKSTPDTHAYTPLSLTHSLTCSPFKMARSRAVLKLPAPFAAGGPHTYAVCAGVVCVRVLCACVCVCVFIKRERERIYICVCEREGEGRGGVVCMYKHGAG
jgi:hypothetical protein